jgi:methanogenic corrinoid protein MtbC1
MTTHRSSGPTPGRPPSGGPQESSDSSASQGPEGHRALLADALEHSVIPRLLQAHGHAEGGGEPPDMADVTGRPISHDDVRELVRLVLLSDDMPARDAVQAFRLRGVPRALLCTDLLVPAARLLGDLWEQDLCTFVDVTVAVGRLQQALRDISARQSFRPADGESVRRVLLVPAPGEQHTFGLVMVSEFFREAGWEVTGGPHPQLDPVAMVRRDWMDVVGFTLAGEDHLASLTAEIAAVRKASLNPRVGILVGGPQFLLNPGLAREVGADALAIDGSLAPSIADKLIETRAKSC